MGKACRGGGRHLGNSKHWSRISRDTYSVRNRFLRRVRGKSFGISEHDAILPRMRMMGNAIGTRKMIGDHAGLFKKKGPQSRQQGANSHSCGAAIFAPLLSFATAASPKAKTRDHGRTP